VSSWQRIVLQSICFIGIVTGGIIIIHHSLGKSASENYVIVQNNSQLKYYLALAKKEHKPVIVDFYADWCPDCQLMETRVFNHPRVTPLLEKFMWLKIDMTKDSQEIWDLQEKYGVAGPPTFLFYTANGENLEQFNFVGNKSETSMAEILRQIIH
jgi:thiol:disulfide interchange protein DsbD